MIRQNRNTGNNIFGSDPQETAPTAGTLAGQYKQTQMKSNIFGNDEPTTTRHVSDKNKSNIFGVGDNDDPSKRQAGGIRQGLRGMSSSHLFLSLSLFSDIRQEIVKKNKTSHIYSL